MVISKIAKWMIFYCGILLSLHTMAQKIEHYKDLCFCRGVTYNSLDTWQNIIDTVTFKKPYTSIIHIGFKRSTDNREHYCSASFIAKNFMITAMHCMVDTANIEYLDLKIPDIRSYKWIRFYKGEFEIFYYPGWRDSAASDIALLKIKNTKKASQVYRSHFVLADFNIDKHDSLTINISGFPCLRFCYTGNCMDTLVNRYADKNDIKINTAGSCLQIPRSTCPGDSGSPVWYASAGQYFIIGITRGGCMESEGLHELPDHTMAVMINADKIKWIQSVISNKIKN